MHNAKPQHLSQNITYIVLFFLLIFRIVFRSILPWMLSLEQPAWFDELWTDSVYLSLGLVIWLNREDLESLNIDKFFIFIFLFTGTWVTIFFASGIFKICTGLGTLFLAHLFRGGNLKFGSRKPNYGLIITLVIFGFVFAFLAAYQRMSVCSKDSEFLFTAFMLSAVVYEEFIFRGILWKFLKHLSFSDRKIYYIQASLFWIAHLHYLGSPIVFWLYTPLFSLIVGLLVWRSKSITSSSVIHYVYNLTSGLLRDYFCI